MFYICILKCFHLIFCLKEVTLLNVCIKPEITKIKKNGLNKRGSDITEISNIVIQSHLFSVIICCLKNMNKNKAVVGNPVAANKNVTELLLPFSLSVTVDVMPICFCMF